MQTLDKELLEINIQKVAEFGFEQKKVCKCLKRWRSVISD